LSEFPWRLTKSLASRKERERTGLTVAEGPPSVLSALEAGARIEFIAVSRSFEASPEFPQMRRHLDERRDASPIQTYVVPDALFEKASGTETPLGVLCVLPWPFQFASDEPAGCWDTPLYLYGVDIQDPGNVGAMVRAAAAVGCGEVSFLGDSADPFSPKCIRASAGAAFKVKVVREATEKPVASLERLHRGGLKVCRAVPRGGVPPWAVDLTRGCVLVLGNEAHGLREDVMAGPGQDVTIPMPGATESLNVALASGMLLYEAMRQRSALRPPRPMV